MNKNTERSGQRRGLWRFAAWSVAALLMALPLAAMQFTGEVNWTAADFAFMGVLLGSVGLAFEWFARKSGSLAYRTGAALVLLSSFLTIWVNAAVGMIGSENNIFNLLFGTVILIAFVGSLLARFKPAGMMRAMVAAAIIQAGLSALGLFTDVRGGVLSMIFAGLWLSAAMMLRKAARDEQSSSGSSPA